MGTCIIWHSLKYVPNNKSNVLEEDHGQGNIFYVVFIHDRILTTYRTIFLQSILRIKRVIQFVFLEIWNITKSIMDNAIAMCSTVIIVVERTYSGFECCLLMEKLCLQMVAKD